MPSSSQHTPVSYRLLVVDSERTILDLLGEVLTEEGARLTLADDLRGALAALDRERFDVILADTLDRCTADATFDCWATLEALKAHAGTTPVLIFSAHPVSAFAEAHTRGFAGFIAKPFDLDVLARTVRLCVEDALARRERQESGSTFAPK